MIRVGGRLLIANHLGVIIRVDKVMRKKEQHSYINSLRLSVTELGFFSAFFSHVEEEC